MWDLLNSYGRRPSRWFEPLSRYAPDPEMLTVYRELAPTGWRLTRRDWWFTAHPPTEIPLEQGWQLHIAGHPDTAVAVLRAALPVLFGADVGFEFLLDRYCVTAGLGKRWPRASSGTFVTVFPDGARFGELATELAKAVAGVGVPAGPAILADRPVPGATGVSYRYAARAGTPRLRADGSTVRCLTAPDGTSTADEPLPYYAPPAWAVDPFDEPESDPGLPLLCDGRFLITGALTYTNAGGVYTAQDRRTGAEVVIKESRPGVLVGHRAVPATETLTREYRLLTALADLPSFVDPVAFFEQDGHSFLVEERIVGASLGRRVDASPVRTGDLRPAQLRDYYQRQRGWWRELSEAIRAAHRRGVLLADLSYENILIRAADDHLVLIDLETAIRQGVDEPVGLHAPGLTAPWTLGTAEVDRAGDYYALGAMMLGSMLPIDTAMRYDRELLTGFLAALADDLALPSGLVELIGELVLTNDEGSDPDADAIHDRIARLDFTDHPDWAVPVPLAGPPQPAGAAADRFGARLDRLIAEGRAAILGTADPGRDDRLVPAHPLAHETNPYALLHGAAGVLHVLRGLGEVPDTFIGWLLARDVTARDCPPGLYTGLAGVAWVLDELGYPRAARGLLTEALDHPLCGAEPGVLAGTAGIGMACLRLWSTGGRVEDDLLAAAVRCGEQLADTAVRDDRGAHWPVASGGTVPIGYAHGAAGVAVFLLYLSLATDTERWYPLGRAALDHDLSEPVGAANLADGSAGLATVLLRYLAVTDDGQLRERWERMRPDVDRKYAPLPHLFAGLAGYGMALLDAAELVGDEQAWAQAWRTAEGIALFAAPVPEGVAFVSERNMRETMDLASGNAGVLMFLDRLRRARPGGRTNTNFLLDELLPEVDR